MSPLYGPDDPAWEVDDVAYEKFAAQRRAELAAERSAEPGPGPEPGTNEWLIQTGNYIDPEPDWDHGEPYVDERHGVMFYDTQAGYQAGRVCYPSYRHVAPEPEREAEAGVVIGVSHHEPGVRLGVDACPGVDERGHGLTMTVVHDSACCREWESGQASTPARAASFRDVASRWGSTWPKAEAGPEADSAVYGPQEPTINDLWTAQAAPHDATLAGCSDAEYDRLVLEKQQTEAAYLEGYDRDFARAVEAEEAEAGL